MSDSGKKRTAPAIVDMKSQGQKIVCLTAYDALLAMLLDQSGVDLILVGDSGAMVFAGHKTTIPFTTDQMVYHTQAVSRGVQHALLISDMPFLSYQISVDDALRNAGRLIQEGGAQGVKVEGGEHMAETVRRLVKMGIPVMGHLGLTPQSINQFGGYRLRGKKEPESEEIRKDAKILEEAGVFAVVLEKIPSALAGQITASLSIPTIGICAGPQCDGQILVTHDMLGLFEQFKPRFARQYVNLAGMIREAVIHYAEDVKKGDFPGDKESY